MKVVFKVTKLENNENNVEVLFGNGDTSCGNTSLETIINSMYDLMTDEQKEKIKLISLYAGNLKFNDCPIKNDVIRANINWKSTLKLNSVMTFRSLLL